MKTGKAPTKEAKYKGPASNEYLSGGQQQVKPPLTDTYASTNLNTTSAARQPSTDRHVRFAADPDPEPKLAPPPAQMMASGLSAGVDYVLS